MGSARVLAVSAIAMLLSGLAGPALAQGAAPVADPAYRMGMPPHRPTPSDDDIDRAAAGLRAAKRVVIVAGEGAAASKAGPEILALAEALAAPVATSLGGRGVIPTRHRLSVGCAGNYAAPPTNQKQASKECP